MFPGRAQDEGSLIYVRSLSFLTSRIEYEHGSQGRIAEPRQKTVELHRKWSPSLTGGGRWSTANHPRTGDRQLLVGRPRGVTASPYSSQLA